MSVKLDLQWTDTLYLIRFTNVTYWYLYSSAVILCRELCFPGAGVSTRKHGDVIAEPCVQHPKPPATSAIFAYVYLYNNVVLAMTIPI